MHIEGEADVRNPERVFGIVPLGGRWYFGHYVESEPVWYHHHKNRIAIRHLLAHVLRDQLQNIAVPNPDGVRAIDPCCGIGTVVVEALSMGINIVGRDINPLVVLGTRKTLHISGLKEQ